MVEDTPLNLARIRSIDYMRKLHLLFSKTANYTINEINKFGHRQKVFEKR